MNHGTRGKGPASNRGIAITMTDWLTDQLKHGPGCTLRGTHAYCFHPLGRLYGSGLYLSEKT